MARTKYQKAAMKYAEDYLERLLRMEDMVGHNVEKKFKKMAEMKQSTKKEKLPRTYPTR